MTIAVGSVCSGIEAASVAWEPLGWKTQWLCENDAFPSAVLKHRFPSIPNLGDMTKIEKRPIYHERAIDLLVGGTPCQSFSIAGLRGGLDDIRGNLALEFCRILLQKQPRWFIWENVPGVLSNNGGRDFGAILGAMAECGYGFAYRIFDAQFFGIPQRRRRVFVIGHLGDWRPPAAILLERESLRWDSPPSRAPWQGSAAAIEGNARSYSSHWDGSETHPSLSQCNNAGGIGQSNQEVFGQRGAGLVPFRMSKFGEYKDDETASTVKARDHKDATDLVTFPVSSIHGTQDPDLLHDRAHTLGRNNGQENAIVYENHAQDSRIKQVDVALTISAKSGTGGNNLPLVKDQMLVRRLTPRECERLMGLPDDWTKIPWRNKPAELCPDGLRYMAIGNSIAIPPLRWLGQRIQLFEDLGYAATAATNAPYLE